MKKYYPLFVVLLLSVSAWGQLQLVAPSHYLGRERLNPLFVAPSSNHRLAATSLSLPFSDNFYYQDASQFFALWDSTGAQIVSLTGAPTARVLRFNGRRSDNTLYDPSGNKVKTDSLISKPISLQNEDQTGKTMLRFSWQGGGTSSKPDSASGEVFVVSVLDNSQNWITVWTSPQNFNQTRFYDEKIALVNPSFFHEGARIKFERFGASQIDSAQWYLAAVALTRVVQLPFWEDFSNPATLSSRFKTNTGVYVNNHLCMNPPSYNVATFDGLDDYGRPYFNNNVFQMGNADSLVSREINLDTLTSGITIKDSLYFSFFYEFAGYGDVPNRAEGDSLILQFLTKEGSWRGVWSSPIPNKPDSTTFQQVLLKLEDTSFFHADFRFKFLNYARLSGRFDLWHIDYIVMDTIKNQNDAREISNGKLFFSDFAISKSPTSVVAPYLSVPTTHMEPALNLGAFGSAVTNLALGENEISPTYSIRRISDAENVLLDSGSVAPNLIQNGFWNFTIPITNTSVSPQPGKFVIRNTVYIGNEPSNLQNYPFQINNSLSSEYTFDDYYAYDDGTYEYGVVIEQDRAMLALGFETFKQDTLSHIDICIPYLGYNMSGTTIFLKVWEDAGGKPGKEIYSKPAAVPANYFEGINPFTRFEIKDKNVIVRGRFFIGYLQLKGNTRAFRIGFDANNVNRARYWIDNTRGAGWSQFSNKLGTPMLRAVFKNGVKNMDNTLARVEDNFQMEIRPNPNSTGLLHFNELFDLVEVSDARGTKRLSKMYTDTLDLSMLETGIYFVRGYLKGKGYSKKLIYQGYQFQ